ncbi:MAG: DnaD domain protein [Eubacteriales bacterium]
MKYVFLYENSAFCLPGSAADAAKKASQNDLRVLIALGCGRFSTEEEIACFLGLSLASTERALEFWRGAGVVAQSGEEISTALPAKKDPEKPKNSAPLPCRDSYTSEEIERICAEKPAVRMLIDECHNILGKDFTKTEISSIVYLSDHLRLDDEYIMMLFTYCKNRDRASIRYIEKTAISLYDDGVVSVGALDAYIKRENEKYDAEMKIRKLFGIGERALSTKQKEFLDKWIISWGYPFELIEKAYDIMVDTIERPTFAYENGILEKWHEAGVATLADAEKFISESKKTPPKKNNDEKETSFDLDEFFELAVKRGAGRADGIENEE